MQQQTAVKQFWQDLQDILPSSVDTETGMKLLKALKRAKKMEKEQMENLWDAAISHGGCKCYDEIMTFEQYYKETFNNKPMQQPINNNKQQTAVDWLVEQLPLIQQEGLIDIIEQAKEMERQQIIDAYHTNPLEAKWKNIGSEYYNETFNK
jgi:hypothetical protein